MLSNKRGCLRRTNVGLDQVSIAWIEVWTTHRLMHEHISKRATRKHRFKESQTGGIEQETKAYQHRMEQRKVQSKHTDTTEAYPTGGQIQTNPRRNGCNHLITKPTKGTKYIAKPRSREANIIIKHRSKQANIACKGNYPNPLI